MLHERIMFIFVVLISQFVFPRNLPNAPGVSEDNLNGLAYKPLTNGAIYIYAMAKREAISKKIRFEVFKRDLFTCQYCGKKAPDVILHVDHVHPHSKGGTNDIINLITSCVECNQGKGARTLSDTSVIDKQRKQIEDLQERKNQIEMMLDWKQSLSDYAEDETKKVIHYFNSHWETYTLNDVGEAAMKSHVKKYGAIAVIEMIDECYRKYGRPESEEKSFGYVLQKVKSELKFNSCSDEEKADRILIRDALRIAKAKYWNFDYDKTIKAISNFTMRNGQPSEIVEIVNCNDKQSDFINALYA